MVRAAGNCVCQRRTTAGTVAHVLASITELKTGKRDGMPLSEPVQLRMVLPDLPKIILIYTAKHHVRHLCARGDRAVRANCDLVHGSAAACEKAAARHLSSFVTGLLHLKPSPSLRQRSGGGADPAVIFGAQPQQTFPSRDSVRRR